MKPVTDTPEAGYYTTTLVKGGPAVPVRIFFSAPIDPDVPRLVDRAPRWQALMLGRIYDVDRLWPHCAKSRIGRGRYRFMLARYRWAVRFSPRSPEASPFQPIDLMRTPTLF